MTDTAEERRLAAIMFTDMVGFSALAQSNEKLALELLAESQRLLRAQFPPFNGREVKTTGDGFLVEFLSALQATECAVQIQRAVHDFNATQPARRHIQVRIGIHVGDVVHRDADVYGDGVNIAARIEPLAVGGGICLSDTVVAQVRNKLDVGLTKIDSPDLRNIETAIDVYRVVLPWQQVPSSPAARIPPCPPRYDRRFIATGLVGLLAVATIGWWLLQHHGEASKDGATPPRNAQASVPSVNSAADQKSVAVLPFVNMSADKDNEYLSDGITEELLDALVKIRGLHVPARTSSFAFKGKNEDIKKIGDLLHVNTVLEGSVRKSGNRLRISAQLINVADGFHLWSQQYDRNLTNVFAIEDEITKAIVGKLKVTFGEVLPVKGRPEKIEAWELYIKGRYYTYRYAEKDLRQAVSYFQQALAKQPDYAKALAGIGYALSNIEFFGYDAPRHVRPLEQAAVQKALELDDSLSEARTQLAGLRLWDKWDWAGSEREYKRAISLDPSSIDAHYLYAEFLYSLSRLQEATVENVIAQRLDPINPVLKIQEGHILGEAREYDRAVAVCRQTMDKSDWFPHDNIAWILFRSGKHAEGIAEEEIAVSLDPGTNQLSTLGRMYGQAGRGADAQRVLRQLLERRRHQYVSAFNIARVYVGVGDFTKANKWMSQAIDQHDSAVTYLGLNADVLGRGNPYYPGWLKKIGLDK